MFSIELNNISKNFGQFSAVSHVDLKIAQGECVALAGHNGAGKSTLIKMMLGIIQPSEGSIYINGYAPNHYEARQQIGYLPETVSLYPSLSALETLNFFGQLKKINHFDAKALLASVGLADVMHKRVQTFSKGMRQRLALAQSLLGEPKLLFFDEPTTGLDPASRQQFYEILAQLRQQGVSILLSTHALAELVGQTDRIIIMKHGHKVADGSLFELREQAQLPTKLICHTQANTELTSPWQKIKETLWSASVSQAEKTLVLANLFKEITPKEIEIIPPTLDDLYARLLERSSI